MTLEELSFFIQSVADKQDILEEKDLLNIRQSITNYLESNTGCQYPNSCYILDEDGIHTCPYCTQPAQETTEDPENGTEDVCPLPEICPNEDTFNYCPECGKQNT